MPDTAFSWRGLREHLRRYLWVYLIGVALCLVGSHVLWLVTGPRLSNEETVTVFLADSFSSGEALDDIAAHALAQTQPFDPTLKEVRFASLMFSEGDYTSSMLLTTRLAVGECDAFMASRAALDALVASQDLVRLDDYVAAGWPGDFGLEPYYATWEDEETGESETYLAGLRLDRVNALEKREALINEGAFLCVAANGGNVETTMKALEYIMSDLMEESDAGTEAP